MPSPNDSLTSLKEILEKEFYKLTPTSQKALVALQKKWPTLVGHVISKNSKLLYIKNHTLYIGVNQASWHCELNLLKDELLKKINSSGDIHPPLQNLKFKTF